MLYKMEEEEEYKIDISKINVKRESANEEEQIPFYFEEEGDEDEDGNNSGYILQDPLSLTPVKVKQESNEDDDVNFGDDVGHCSNVIIIGKTESDQLSFSNEKITPKSEYFLENSNLIQNRIKEEKSDVDQDQDQDHEKEGDLKQNNYISLNLNYCQKSIKFLKKEDQNLSFDPKKVKTSQSMRKIHKTMLLKRGIASRDYGVKINRLKMVQEVENIRAQSIFIKKESLGERKELVIPTEVKCEYLRAFFPGESTSNKYASAGERRFLMQQKKRAADLSTIPCKICGFYFEPKLGMCNGMQKHFTDRHQEHVKKEKEKFENFKRTLKAQNEGDNYYQCSTNSTIPFKAHLLIKKCVCPFCKSQFKTEEELKGHLYICENPLSCDICEKRVPTIRALKDHHAFEHNGPGKREYFCIKCGASFLNIKMLENHSEEAHL